MVPRRVSSLDTTKWCHSLNVSLENDKEEETQLVEALTHCVWGQVRTPSLEARAHEASLVVAAHIIGRKWHLGPFSFTLPSH